MKNTVLKRALAHDGGHCSSGIRRFHHSLDAHAMRMNWTDRNWKADMDADVSADRSYIAGMRHGFRLETADQLAEAIEARRPKRADIEHFTRKADDRAAEMADWRFCPSTHCERRQECCSPHECAAKRI